MQIRFNTQSPHFGYFKIDPTYREVHRALEAIINDDPDTAKAAEDAFDRIDKASGDVRISLYGVCYDQFSSLNLRSAKYKTRGGYGPKLPKIEQITPETTKEERCAAFKKLADDFDEFLHPEETQAGKIVKKFSV